MKSGLKEQLIIEAGRFSAFLEKASFITLYSHNDADGLSSAALFVHYLRTKGKQFKVRVLRQLENDFIPEADSDMLIFVDFGSKQLINLKKYLSDKVIVILDHHQLGDIFDDPNLIHLNPHLFSEENEASASTIAYSFLRQVGLPDFFAPIAVCGALGDNKDLSGFNLDTESKIKKFKDLAIYGRGSRPLHRALQFSNDPVIPKITGSESSSVQFLSALNIPLRDGDSFRTIKNLSEDEKQKLIAALVLRGCKPDELIRDVYEDLKGTDLREQATLLNACGRMGAPNTGILFLLGDKQAEASAFELMNEYAKSIACGIDWIFNNKGSLRIFESKNAVYLFGGSDLKHEIIGAICSIILSSEDLTNKSTIVGFADREDHVKVSVRSKTLDVAGALKNVVLELETAESGGHIGAGGAKIKKGDEKKFVDLFEKAISNL